MKISMIVPVRNEAGSVAALLESISTQTRRPDEVLIVDGGSTDGTPQLIHEWLAGRDLEGSTRILVTGGASPGEGRNLGAEQALYEWLAFTDAGIVLEPGWLQELAAGASSGCDVVYGSYEPVCDRLFLQSAAIAYVPAKERWGGRTTFAASLLIRRALFRHTDGFPPWRAAEDLAFSERLRSRSPAERYAPKAIVHWQLAPDLGSTFRRFALYSYHNLLAGRGRHWHLGIAMLYLYLILILALAWILLGPLAAAATMPLFYLSRAVKAGWLKRRSLAFNTLSPIRVVSAALLLVFIDVATLAGAIRWLCREPGQSR